MNQTRRDAIKKLAYITPAILTLPANPSYASGGSGYTGPSDDREKTEIGSWLEDLLVWLGLKQRKYSQ